MLFKYSNHQNQLNLISICSRFFIFIFLFFVLSKVVFIVLLIDLFISWIRNILQCPRRCWIMEFGVGTTVSFEDEERTYFNLQAVLVSAYISFQMGCICAMFDCTW